ncbi:hypothetical protein EBT23_04950, partial [bacterium]|nr:hypothetical protein [bacterium]
MFGKILSLGLAVSALSSLQLSAAVITWDTGHTYVTQTGVASDAYAQLIPGTVVEAKYSDMSRT